MSNYIYIMHVGGMRVYRIWVTFHYSQWYCLFVFYVLSTARSFRDGPPFVSCVKFGKYTVPTRNQTPHLLSLAKDVKFGKYTVPTRNQTPGPLRGSPLRYCCATQTPSQWHKKINCFESKLALSYLYRSEGPFNLRSTRVPHQEVFNIHYNDP